MKLSAESDRWTIYPDRGRPYDLHCGGLFELKIGERYHPCRIEMGSDWYVIFSGASFHLIRSRTYDVRYIPWFIHDDPKIYPVSPRSESSVPWGFAFCCGNLTPTSYAVSTPWVCRADKPKATANSWVPMYICALWANWGHITLPIWVTQCKQTRVKNREQWQITISPHPYTFELKVVQVCCGGMVPYDGKCVIKPSKVILSTISYNGRSFM